VREADDLHQQPADGRANQSAAKKYQQEFARNAGQRVEGPRFRRIGQQQAARDNRGNNPGKCVWMGL